MGLREAWRALRSTGAPYRSKEAPVVAYSNVGTQLTPKDSYKELAKDGYIDNPIVNRCVNEIANGAASVKFTLMRGDQPIDDHPLLSLLERPSPFYSQ